MYYNKALQEGFNVCEHHKCFILPMHRLGCWRETVVCCAGTCLCNIMSFCVYLIAAVSFSIPLLPPEKEGGCNTIVLTVVRRVNGFEWSCFFVYMCVWVPRSVFLVCRVFLSLHKWLRTRVWWSGTHGDSIMHMTATKNHSGQTGRSVQACTQKWPLNVHTRPTFKCHHSLKKNRDQKENKSR